MREYPPGSAVDAARRALGDEPVTDGGNWDEPLPIGWRVDLPSFPVEALPGVLGRYVAALSEATQTPADLAGSVVLGIASGCIGGRVRVTPRPGWTEPTNLWTVPVLPSGSRKSAVVEAASAPLMTAEDVLREVIEEARRDATIELDARQKYAAQMLTVAAKHCEADALKKAQEAAADAEAITVPPWPQLTVDDATPEALVTLLAEQGGRMVAISAEAGIIDALAGTTYSSSKKGKLEAILKAHAGDTIRVNRQMREPQLVRRPALTLIATIQPYALHELAANAEFAGRGLLQRVLWSLPPDNVGFRIIGAPPVPDALAEEYAARISGLAVSMASRADVVTLHLDDAAREVHLNYERRIEVMLRPAGEMGGTDVMRSWGSKLAGATLRIAGTLHAVIEGANGPIGEEAMRRAVVLSEYYRQHAVAALRRGESESAKDMRLLLRWLVERVPVELPRTFKVREVMRSVRPGHLRHKAALEPVLAGLVDHGWIRPAGTSGAYLLHPVANELMKAGDSGDSGDADDEPPAQGPD